LFTQPDQAVYGSGEISIDAFSTSGLVLTFNSSDPSVAIVTDSKIIIRGTGTTTITASQPGNKNYNPAAEKRVVFNVGKATLTVTAENKSKYYLSPVPQFTYTCAGFVNGDDISVIDKLPVATTEAVTDSPAGEYEITISGGEDNCYSFKYVSGMLQIFKAGQEVKFISHPERLLINETFPLEAAASSGLPVYFESRNPEIAEVNGAILKGTDRGSAVIRALQPGNQNYEPGESAISIEVFSTHKGILNLFTPNNDGFNDLWEIPDRESYGRCDVRIFNRWGKLVYTTKDYKNDWDGKSESVDVPEGAYYFIIKSEKKGTLTGTINIIR
jgi:gliding motility-associated-like protein